MLLLLACLPKSTVTKAPLGTEIRFEHWMKTEAGKVPLPPAVLETVQTAMWTRNVRGVAEGSAAPIATVGCTPTYDTAVEGRFRWDLSCDVSIVDGTRHIEREVSEVVHLATFQEREADALAQGSTSVRRELARALEDWLKTP